MRNYWYWFIGVIVISFAVLGWVGIKIYQEAPPKPQTVKSTEGEIIFSPGEIDKGQNIWQAMGGMELGSIWGHGSYIAPDWTADWLHRESVFILDEWADSRFNKKYDDLDTYEQDKLKSELSELMKANRYDESTQTLTVETIRAKAIKHNIAYYQKLFLEGREEYAMPPNIVPDPERARKMAGFFFWSAWAAAANRPDSDMSYTSNWPHEELIGNKPTSDTIIWTGVSIIFLLSGIGFMAWYYATRREHDKLDTIPKDDPLLYSKSTPSQKATVKYFLIVTGLFLLQIVLGVITAHYGVEGTAFYGIPIADILPYTISRTWHTQLGIFWIATAWLAAGLYIGPSISGTEPKGQKIGVNILFGALLVVVLGSMAGEWLSVMGYMSDDYWFYFGHSGYEYIDLGRFFQIALLIGLFLWLYLMSRSIIPAIRKNDEQKPILTLFLISCIAIAGFYGAALGYGKTTNLAIAEYWRWWVVHLWVEGFFEVFATVVIAFLFARMKLISVKTAGQATILAATIFLTGGIIGTLHHLYFAGTPIYAMALGSVFSALEVVPLVFVGYEAVENYRISKQKDWIKKYKWPIYFFISVAFWNLLGAGIFGFMINPPIALYYMQGLNTTPVHGHAALFGVYGMLGIGLMLFSLRALAPDKEWKEKTLKISFWSLNFGLFAMVVFSLLPVGLMQTWASVEYGYWYARSAEFLNSDIINTFKWLRAFGDTIFGIGGLALGVFILGLLTGKSYK